MQNLERNTLLELKEISKAFPGKIALENISFEIREGEFLSLLGPSGSGKTTLLRIVVGLECPDKGKVILRGEVVSSPGYCKLPHKRNIGMVFQELGLWPHMNVEEHLRFALSGISISKSEKEKKLNQLLEILTLQEYKRRFPYQLSGGEKQRLAIGRALATESRMLLLDEPLANLDLELKIGIQKILLGLNKNLGITIVYVTHDQIEALMLSERIILLNGGRIEQIDSPYALINYPRSNFVTEFVRFDYNFIAEMRGRLFL